MSKFKVGDKVIVASTNYTISEDIVGLPLYITGHDGFHWEAKSAVASGTRHFDDEDLELYVEESDVSDRALDRQTGGSHYKDLKIQPMEYALKNNLNYAQANTVKYVTRYKNKNGIEDLRKAIHCIELLIEHEEGLDNK